MAVEVDARFRDDIERLLTEGDLLDLDALMDYDGYFDELPLFATYAQVAFLQELPPLERNGVLIRAAVAHLDQILAHARHYFAGRAFDFFCAVTITGWDHTADDDPLVPRFWRANPSNGVFEHLRLQPPTSEGSNMIEHLLNHDPDYVLGDDVVDEGGQSSLARVFIQHRNYQVPESTIKPS